MVGVSVRGAVKNCERVRREERDQAGEDNQNEQVRFVGRNGWLEQCEGSRDELWI